jgi:L-fuculose-phosphate aldolase
VKDHSTILLANHGIVCWGDTVTHAEWSAEVLETYCRTLMLAAQLGAPITYISEQQGADLPAIKKKLGLPDARFDNAE